MTPTYKQGDWVLVNRLAYFVFPPTPGDVVVLTHPHRPNHKIIKRIVDRSTSGFIVRGDNESFSTDSRDFGPIRRSDIIGNVFYKGND